MGSVLRYGSARLFGSVATSPTVLRALTMVNSVQFGFSVPRQEIKSVGFSKMSRAIVSPPVPTVSFNYFLSDLDNDKLFSLPVTSHEAYALGIPLFESADPFDLAFVTDENQRDFERISDKSELSVCLITNAYIDSYSFNIDPSGIINVSVSFSGDNIIFKVFKNLSKYSVLESDSEDNQMTNQIDFMINDEIDEPTSMVGGGNVISKVDRFDFSANIPYKNLYDFGQFYHKKKIDHPLITKISISALVDKFFEGELSDILCNDKKNDFLILNKRRECPSGNVDVKAGMLFKGAKLISQEYSMETSGFLRTNLSFDLVTNRDCGIYFTQHVQVGEALTAENPSSFDHMEVEDGTGALLLVEAILNMKTSLESFRVNSACSGEE